ncbi:hypothetical protein F2Q68_00033431 [Brassica cretica]|uniref:Uncharacterized protein n=1 Tax=Brassica cretica TaxID=69181 RepID=A0A8S9H1F2_BRACR|nr:hypothetical protein F2Q68_00033431 [Brassica cretica]
MENIERDRPTIDGDTFPSSDDESEESTDTELPTSFDTAQPEAGKFSLTKPANEKVVQTELNGQTSNETSQTEQGTEIPGRTYSNRSAITIPGDDTKKAKFNADYYRMIDDNALSDTDDYSDEEMNCSDPYSVLHVESFTQAYDTTLKSRTGRERFNIRQALTGNPKTKSEFYGKINMVYGELMEKADSLGELIQKLEGQVAEIAIAIKRDAGCLPGRTDLNPRRQVSARDQPSIDGDTFPSSDVESEESTDAELTTSIDTAQPEAGKFSLTKPANEKVVQTELNGQTSNEASQTEQGTGIPVKENSTLTKGEDIKLSIQDYLDPGRTYSNWSAIKIPGDDTKKSKFNADYYRMIEKATSPKDNSDLIEIKNSLKSLHSFLQNKHRSDIAQIDDNALSDTDDYLDEGMNCSDPYSVLHVDSFTQAYDTPVKSCTGRERFNIRQAFTGNRKTKSEFYGKINMVYGELMEKADSLGELIRKLEGQVAEIATAIKRDAGCLPGRRNYRSVGRSLQRCISRCTSSHIDQHSLEIKIRQLRSEI